MKKKELKIRIIKLVEFYLFNIINKNPILQPSAILQGIKTKSKTLKCLIDSVERMENYMLLCKFLLNILYILNNLNITNRTISSKLLTSGKVSSHNRHSDVEYLHLSV